TEAAGADHRGAFGAQAGTGGVRAAAARAAAGDLFERPGAGERGAGLPPLRQPPRGAPLALRDHRPSGAAGRPPAAGGGGALGPRDPAHGGDGGSLRPLELGTGGAPGSHPASRAGLPSGGARAGGGLGAPAPGGSARPALPRLRARASRRGEGTPRTGGPRARAAG